MRHDGKTLALMVLLLVPTNPALGQSVNLQADPRLQAKMTLSELNPDLSVIFNQLEKATSLKFTLAEPIAEHRPKLGALQLRNLPAWRIMEFIPKIGLEGGRWEKTQDGYRLTAKAMTVAKEVVAQQKALPRDLHLRKDPRLQVKVSLESSPKLPEVLQLLKDATGLTFELADYLQNHQPDLGSVKLRNVPAWMAMTLLAEGQMTKGHWEKTPTGYRLEGESLAPAPEKPLPANFWWWVLVGVAILSASILVWLRLRRKKPEAARSAAVPVSPGQR